MSLHASIRASWEEAAVALRMARSYKRLAQSGLVLRPVLRIHVPKAYKLVPYKAGVTTYADDASIMEMPVATINGCSEVELAELIIIKLQGMKS